jgi:hypothetical protein
MESLLLAIFAFFRLISIFLLTLFKGGMVFESS